MKNIKDEQNTLDYWKGYDSKIEEIRDMGWDAARDKFNFDYPIGYTPANLGAYYYSKGEFYALEFKR